MENIRATEIQRFKRRNFFGLSRFLMVVFAILVVIFTMVMYIGNNQKDSVDQMMKWPAIVVFVLGGLMLLAFLVKGKYKSAIFTLVIIVINVLLLAKVIPAVEFGVKAREFEKAHQNEQGLAVVFQNQYGMINSGINAVLFAIGVVNFVFTIIAISQVRDGNIGEAFKAKVGELRNNPDLATNRKALKRAVNKLKRRTNKMARKNRFVPFCHELGVLCILDDPGYNDKYFIEGESKFTGSVIMLGLYSLLWGFLNTITLGILIPWTTSWKHKYYAERTTYSGQKVKFDGKGIQLLGRWVLWELLSIITLGIYAFFMAIALKKWVTKHQHFEGEEEEKSKYTGTTFGRGLLAFGLKILQFISLGFATPYCVNRMARYDMEHTNISGHQLVFGGTAGKLFLHFLLWMALSVVTFGIYAILVMPMNMTKYSVHYSRIRDMSYDPASDPR